MSDIESKIVVNAEPNTAEPVAETPATPVNDGADSGDQGTPASDESVANEERSPLEKAEHAFLRKINRANRKLGERDNQIAQRDQLIAEYEERLAKQQGVARTTESVPAKPTLEGCGYDQEVFADKYADWRDQQREMSKAQQTAQDRDRKDAESYQGKVAAFSQDHPDFEDVVTSANVPLANPVLKAIMRSAKAPDIAYHLATHADIAIGLSQMDVVDAVREIGKIETHLGTTSPAAKPQLTRAPPVAPMLQGTGLAAKPLESKSVADFIEENRAKRSR